MHARTFAIHRGEGRGGEGRGRVMYNIALAIRIAVSVSAAFIPYGLRTCGITILLASNGGYCDAGRRGAGRGRGGGRRGARENCVTPFYSSTLSPKKSCPRLFYERLENSPEHREITNA